MASTDTRPGILKPTPGPWRVVRTMDAKRERAVLFIEGACPTMDGAPVACVGNPMMPFVEANAYLIAAAPDLYEAAEAVLEGLLGMEPMTVTTMAISLQSVLAKARGESP